MLRTFLALAFAVALFFAGSVALVFRLTATNRDAPPAGPALAADDAPPPPPAVAVAPAAAPSGPRPPPIVLSPDAPALGPKAPPAWLSAPTRRLGPQPDHTALGPLRPYVAAGLARLRTDVAECASEAPPGAPTGAREGGGTTLTLRIESLDNQLRIADATVADARAADDWRVACARRKLRGKLIPAPTRPGTSLEVPFVLSI